MFKKNWEEEKSAAYLYYLIAQCEENAIRKKLFLELEIAAETQARIWENKFKKTHKQHAPLIFKPDFRTRFVGKLIKQFGTKQIRFILSAMKVRGMSIYSGAPISHPAESHLEQRHKG